MFFADLQGKKMVYAYVRVSREHQSCSSQRYEIANWLRVNNMVVDSWIMESASGTLPPDKRKLGKAFKRMKKGDLLVCTEISRLGRNVLMIMAVLNECAQREIQIRTIKDNFDLSNNINSKIIAFAFALAAEIERNLISQRTKEALADKKASGVVLGRPVGSFKAKQKILKDRSEILARLERGESRISVARGYGIHPNTLRRYLKEI